MLYTSRNWVDPFKKEQLRFIRSLQKHRPKQKVILPCHYLTSKLELPGKCFNQLINFNWRIITLKYMIVFAIYQHESSTYTHMSPHLPPYPFPMEKFSIKIVWMKIYDLRSKKFVRGGDNKESLKNPAFLARTALPCAMWGSLLH